MATDEIHLKLSKRARNASPVDRLLGHWGWAIPALLIVALFALQDTNRHAPSLDEFYAMINVGWVVDGPFSPTDTLESLARRSPQQAPLYYLLLNFWGNLVPPEIAFARILSLFFGLLFLALCFRIVREFVAPPLGLIALAIIASNAFLNLYFPFGRMYTLYLLAAAMALWFYLRVMFRQRPPERRNYIGLVLACLALAATHAFSLLDFAAVGAFHLLLAPKSRRWLRASLCVALALLLYSPWALLISRSVQFTLADPRFQEGGVADILIAFGKLMSNGAPALLLIPLAGLFIAWRRRHIALHGYHLLIIFYVIVVLGAAHLSNAFGIQRMRYMLPGALFLLLAQAAGIYALYRIRRWLGLLALLWIIAGLLYHNHRSAYSWAPEADDRAFGIEQPPFHEIGRHARSAASATEIYGYRINTRNLRKKVKGAGRPLDHYFDLDRVNFRAIASLDELNTRMGWNALSAPSVWLFYQSSDINAAEAEALDGIMNSYHYARCQDEEFALDTLLLKYWWSALACRAPQPHVSAETALITYQFLGAREVGGGQALAFSDLWRSRADVAPDQDQMSYQVLDEDWSNVASLDLALVAEGRPRQFTIDIKRLPAGAYRLMAVLYDKDSGERFEWSNGDKFAPEMLALAELEI